MCTIFTRCRSRFSVQAEQRRWMLICKTNYKIKRKTKQKYSPVRSQGHAIDNFKNLFGMSTIFLRYLLWQDLFFEEKKNANKNHIEISINDALTVQNAMAKLFHFFFRWKDCQATDNHNPHNLFMSQKKFKIKEYVLLNDDWPCALILDICTNKTTATLIAMNTFRLSILIFFNG